MAAAENQSGRKNGSGFDMLSVTLLTLAVLLFVYALSLFLQGGFLAAQKVNHQAKLDLSGDPALELHTAEQLDLLNGQSTWVDPEAGTVSLPIEAAKARLAEEMAEEASSNEAGAAHE